MLLPLSALPVQSMAADRNAARNLGNASGTGGFPAVAQADPSLPTHTIYRPVTLPKKPMPLVIWGNGACRDNGLQHAMFLRQIASRGYLVISLGHPREERGISPNLPAPVAGSPPPPPAADETNVGQMDEAIVWATAQNAKKGGALAGHVDLNHVAVMGHSCGGLQSITMSADPRIKTSIIFNSGVYNKPSPTNRSRIAVGKDALDRLHGPIAYFHGGPTDIAQPNADDDVSRITKVPVFLGVLPVGHEGTFWKDENGGAYGEVAGYWLDWQLKGDKAAGRWFSGKDCKLCVNPQWRVVRHNMD